MATAPAWGVLDIARQSGVSGVEPDGMRFANTTVVRRAIDGEACVAALLRAGFHMHHRGQGIALLKRGVKMVLVPAVESVTPQMFEAIARSAGLSDEELEKNLPRVPKSSGMFARPDVSELSPPSSASGGRRRRR